MTLVTKRYFLSGYWIWIKFKVWYFNETYSNSLYCCNPCYNKDSDDWPWGKSFFSHHPYLYLFFLSSGMKYFLLSLFLLINAIAFSQKTWQGSVLDGKTNLPLEGATISLLPINITTITDERGRFIFSKNVSVLSSVQIS